MIISLIMTFLLFEKDVNHRSVSQKHVLALGSIKSIYVDVIYLLSQKYVGVYLKGLNILT